MTALLYARYSTDMQSETSVDDQWSICESYAKLRNWLTGQRFSDRGISGAAVGNRPGFKAAIQALDVGDVLLVTDLSRLSRSQDLAPLLSRLRHRGVQVIGVQDGFDSDSRTARMQAGMSGIMSEEFRMMIGDRVHSALEFRARAGKSPGGKAYGEIEIVREAFERFAAGESLKRIAADFNDRKIPSPGASWKARANPRGKWLVSAVRAMLLNEKYIGRDVWNRSKWVKDPDTGKRIRRERPESEWIVRQFAPIVDRPIWNAAQARFKTMDPHVRAQRFLLSGLLECGICGSKLVISGGSMRRYRCGANHAGGASACSNGTTFPQQIAEELILQQVVDQLLSDEAIALGVKALRQERAAPTQPRPTVNAELKELQRLVSIGILSPDVAAPAIDAARRKFDSVVTVAPFAAPVPSAAVWRAGVLAMREILLSDDVTAARQALRGVLGPIPCTPAEDYVIASLAAREVALGTGTNGRFCGSGGALQQNLPIPISTRPPKRRFA